MNSSLVSVVIPCHNRSAFLEKCFFSVAYQTCPTLEVIVVDEASAEKIKAAIDNACWPSDYYVEHIRSDENKRLCGLDFSDFRLQ